MVDVEIYSIFDKMLHFSEMFVTQLQLSRGSSLNSRYGATGSMNAIVSRKLYRFPYSTSYKCLCMSTWPDEPRKSSGRRSFDHRKARNLMKRIRAVISSFFSFFVFCNTIFVTPFFSSTTSSSVSDYIRI